MLKKFFGDRAFYRRVLLVAVPIMIQNGITNFVSLLDNIMVGQVGTVQMNGVAVSNQLMFVFNLCIFGAVSGAGIFTAQYHGSGDHDGVRYTFRYKIMAGIILSAVGAAVFAFFGPQLINLFLQGEGNPADAALSLEFGYEYLLIMLIGILPFALSNVYSSTLRETGQTVVPMIAGVSAVAVNLGLNYVLIFGHFGAPAMGVAGAAVATVISRYVELAVVAVWTHTHADEKPFIRGAFRSMRIPARLMSRFIIKGSPLMVNEFLWSMGVTMMNQSYSTCGLDVVSAQNIYTTLYNLSSVVYMALGGAVGIIIGQMLGRGDPPEAVRDEDRKLITMSVLSCVLFGGIVAAVSGVFPMMYNTTDSVRSLATQFLCIGAFMMPFHAFVHASYFTIRSGGQTGITFLFDSVYMWVLCVPLAFCLSRFTDLPIIPLYCICQGADLLKCALGAWLLHRGSWIRNLTER